MYEFSPPAKVKATTPRIGKPRLMKVLQMPTAVMAAVLAVGVTPKLVSMPYWTARPTAPPAGTPLLIANAAWFTCSERQNLRPGVAALNGKP